MRRLAVGEDLVDRHRLARLRAGEQLVVVIAPPRRDAGAEHPALISRIAARPRHDVEDAHLQHVAGLRVLHRDRAGADVHAEPFAGAAAEHGGIHRTGAATIDVLPSCGPAEHAFGAGIARDHPFGIVGGMLRQRFDRDGVAGIDLDLRRQRAAEITPMHARGLHREVMMVRPAAVLGSSMSSDGQAALAFAAVRLMRARLRQRILRPAALAGRMAAVVARSASCWRNSRGGRPKRWRNARLKCAELPKP